MQVHSSGQLLVCWTEMDASRVELIINGDISMVAGDHRGTDDGYKEDKHAYINAVLSTNSAPRFT